MSCPLSAAFYNRCNGFEAAFEFKVVCGVEAHSEVLISDLRQKPSY